MRFPRFSLLRQTLSYMVPVAAAVLLATAMAWGQKFAQPQIVPTPAGWPAAIYTADINADGIADLIYVDHGATPNNPSTTHVLLGDGKGGFAESAKLATVGSALTIGTTIGGFPGVSILWAQGTASGFSIFIAEGKGDGTFRPATGIAGSVAGGAKIPVIGYLGVGRFIPPIAATAYSPELAVEDNANGLVYEFLFNPDGSHVTTIGALPDGSGPMHIVPFGTYQGLPGNLLAVEGSAVGSVQIFPAFKGLALPSSPPTQPSARYKGNGLIHSLLTQDANGDGISDLIAEGANGHIDIFLGNGDGTFQTTAFGGSGSLDGTTGSGGHLIAAADLSHDGLTDLVTATPIGISSMIQNSTSGFGLKGVFNGGPGNSSYALADFNSDGNLDLAVDSPEGIAILYGNSDGSFQTSVAFPAGAPAMSAALGAFTRSGFLDAVVSTAETQGQLLRGNGDGTFSYAGSPGAPIPTTTQAGFSNLWSVVQTGDFNGDGKLDLAFTADGSFANVPSFGSGVNIQLGAGDGTFAAPVHTPVNQGSGCGLSPHLMYGRSAVADFNLDGTSDVANRDMYEEFVHLGRPNLYPLYEQEIIPDADCTVHAHDLVVVGDFNNDGLADLIVQTDGHLNLELNQGAAAFNQSEPLGGFTLDTSKDLSIDGSLTTLGQMTAPALSSTFGGTVATSAGGLGFPAFIGSAVVADLDRDGNSDLIVTYANLAADRTAPVASAPNYIYIWYGSGGGRFLTSAKHPVNPVRLAPSRNFYQAAVADMDGDGIPDLILSDGYILSVQLGKGDGTFGAETHYLAGQGLNTISVADVNHDGTLDLVIANGGTVWSNPVANLEQPPAAQDVNTGGITVLLNRAVAPLPSITGTVTATPEPSTYGSAFSITATITPSGTNNNPVTGSFSFAVDGIAIGSAAITGTSVSVVAPSFLYSTLTPGVHTLTAAYSGDSNWAASNLTGTHTVSLNPTQISLLLCVDPPGSNFPCGNPINQTPLISPITMYYGQSVDGVAIESATNLTGTITFYSGSSVFCVLNANLMQGTQTCPPASGCFPVGTTTVTVVYSGDSLNSGSTSNGVVVTVLPDPTTAMVDSSLNPSTFGQSVTFTASVQGNFAAGAGPVLFLDGATTLATVTLDATGHASFTTATLAVGTHPIRVAFPGSASFGSTTSGILNQVVLAANTSIQSIVTLSSSVNPSAPGQAVTFTATISATGTLPTLPAGSITFFDGAATIGTGAINPATGIATFTTSTLALGSHPITATYAGATVGTVTVVGATSGVLTQVVAQTGPSGFSLAVTPAPVTVGAGNTAILLATVKAFGGFSQPVALTCTGLLPESACTFVLSTVPSGGGSTTLQLHVSAPHDCGTTTPYFVGSANQLPPSGTVAAATVPALFAGGLLVAGIRRRRKGPWIVLTILAASLCALAMVSGCGNCTDLGTKPGNYTITVVATAQGGPSTETHSQLIPVTVTIP